MNNFAMVSIVMATFNRAHFIEESLRAIQNQTYQNWECLVIDDGSTDNTASLVKKIAIQDHRFIYHKRSSNYNKGLPGSRNMGIDNSKGTYIVFFDDDDIPHPRNLELCISHFSSSVSYVRYSRSVFHGIFDYGFSTNRIYKIRNLDQSVVPEMVMQKIPFNSCQIVWRKECFHENRFNEKLMFAEEWECYSRILTKSYISGVSIDKILFYARKHSRSNTGEFQQKNNVRIKSKVLAAKLIIGNLEDNKALSLSLSHYFIRLSFKIKSYDLLSFILNKSSYSILKKELYKFIFILYPLFRPLFILKGKCLRIFRSKS